MKKFAIFGICLVAALGLSACVNEVPPSAPPIIETMNTLNSLVAKDYNSITLNVSTTIDGITLAGSYVMAKGDDGIHVEYTYEKMNLIEKNEDGSYRVPDTVKSTHTGAGIIKEGAFEATSGETVDIAVTSLNVGGLTFDESYFENINDGVHFTADVKNPVSFLGRQIVCIGMKVEVDYSVGALSSLKISYISSEAAQVVLLYRFA